MKYYFAPMEGFTDRTYRKLHSRFFPGTDEYFTPFIAVSQSVTFSSSDRKELTPENPAGSCLVPQLLSKNAGQFAEAVKKLQVLGFHEVNLNLGCPSGTVVPKGKGAGMLRDPDNLEIFLSEAFRLLQDTPVRISVKTRLGFNSPDESTELIRIFNCFPISELIVHARTKTDFYQGPVRMDAFREMYRCSIHPVVYNGDLLSAGGCRETAAVCPGLQALMIGRGLLINPALIREAKGGDPLAKEEYLSFLEELFRAWSDEFHSEGNALCRMKDLWKFVMKAFDENKSGIRSVQKSKNGNEYRSAVRSFFRETNLNL